MSEKTSRKLRLDQVLVAKGLFASREQAQRAVMAGEVKVGTRIAAKPSQLLEPDVAIAVKPTRKYVGRGALKLEGALNHFEIDTYGKIALDIGASTGGFTDVLLARGAARVHAVDVGRGQLAWKLRQDPRVVVHEATNARYLAGAQIPEPIDLITCDASFIGLSTLLPAPLALAADRAQLVALIKPQFEAGANAVGKGGVVRDPAIHQAVCDRIAAWIATQPGWRVIGIAESPIQGPAGNREFLIYARRGE